MRTSLDAISRARSLRHVNSLTYALAYGGCLVAMLCGDAEATQRLAEELIEISTRHRSLFWGSYGTAYKGWALARQGDAGSVPLLEEALRGFEQAGSGLYAPLSLGVSAYALGRAGRSEEALARAEAAVAEAERREEAWCLPELLRLKARVLQELRMDGARPLLDRALALSRLHGMRSWELRIACDRAVLERTAGCIEDAAAGLQSALDGFPESSDTADRRRARALLDAGRYRDAAPAERSQPRSLAV